MIGAGIAGMTTAYLLMKKGCRVVLLSDAKLGGGMTSRTTAHLSSGIDDRYAARRAGVEGVEWAPRAPIAAFDTGVCLRFPHQGQFHPLKYLAGLAHAARTSAARCTGTRWKGPGTAPATARASTPWAAW